MATERNRIVSRASVGKARLDLRILRYLPMVPSIPGNVERRILPPLDFSNLVKDGVAGLLEGARNSPRQPPISLRTFAKCRIKSAIPQEVCAETPSARWRLSETRSVGTRQTQLGDAFLRSLFGLQQVMNSSGESAFSLSEMRQGGK